MIEESENSLICLLIFINRSYCDYKAVSKLVDEHIYKNIDIPN